MSSDKDTLRTRAEKDLYFFAKLVGPRRVYGECHKRLFYWWMQQEQDKVDCTLVLWPRDHQKSHCAAVYAAWVLTKDPASTILYVSATAYLAEKQLKAIKDIITSDVYRRYWPEMVHPDEGKREKWTNSEISVDHPTRGKEAVRDPSVKAAGLTTNITGAHASHVFLDDIVVPDNAYTELGRETVRALYSQLASVESTGAKEIVVGTRYHPADIYQDLIDMKEQVFDASGEVEGTRNVYKASIEVVETEGVFLWPREARGDGKLFGFDFAELARKRAKYLDKAQFFAQYYQNPNDISTNRLSADAFLRYDAKHVKCQDGRWSFKGRPLNIFASIDFAFSLSERADYTAIVVIGIDSESTIYVLDINRFKTNNIDTYYQEVLQMHSKWQFKKLRAETTQAQQIIANDLQARAASEGLPLRVDSFKPLRGMGAKEERIAAVLEPRYAAGSIMHGRGGYFPVLEEELVLSRPAHDDVKDALAMAVEIARPPARAREVAEVVPISYHKRFGGVAIG